MRSLCVAAATLLPALAWAGASQPHFTVEAHFIPAKKPAAESAIAVSFKALNPDVRINEEPAPRLKLDPQQRVLDYKAPAGPMAPPNFDPAFAKYLDLGKPVSFPVSRAAQAAPGPQPVKGNVVFFYCSKKEGWCKKGSSDFEVTVE